MTAIGEMCESTARLELARTGLYTPLHGDGSDLQPVEMMSYNLINGTHFHSTSAEVSGQGEIFPAFFDQLTPVGYRVYATSLDAVAFMNHVKGDKMQQAGNMRVRTLFEKLNSKAAAGVVEGWRVFHMLCKTDAAEGARTEAGAARSASKPLVAENAEESATVTTGAASYFAQGGAIAAPRATPIAVPERAPLDDDAPPPVPPKAAGVSSSSSSSSSSSDSSSDSSNDSEAEEVSSDVDEGDEEAVARADAKRAKKKTKPVKISKKMQAAEGLKTFAGGFEAVAAEGRQYRRAMLNKTSETNRAALLKAYPTSAGADSHTILRRTREVGKEEHAPHEARLIDMLKQQTVAEQFAHVIVPYLAQDGNVHRDMKELAAAAARDGTSTHAFVDPRPCTNLDAREELARASAASAGLSTALRYADFGGRLDPDRALGPITALTYHTEGIDPTQCDLSRYFTLPKDTVDRVLANKDKFGNEESPDDGGDGTKPVDENAMDVDEAPRAAVARKVALTRAERLTHAFTRHSRRVELMESVGPLPALFSGFPCPEGVYELSVPLCRPEIAPLMPLPHDVGVVVPVALTAQSPEAAARELQGLDRTRVGLADKRFKTHVNNTVTAAAMIADNLRGVPCDPAGAHAPLAMEQRGKYISNALVGIFESLTRDHALPSTLRSPEAVCSAALALLDVRNDLKLSARTRYSYFLTATLDYHFHSLCAANQNGLEFDRSLREAFVNDSSMDSTDPEAARQEHAATERVRGKSDDTIAKEWEETRKMSELVSKLREMVEKNITAVADRAEHVRAPPTGSGPRTQDELFDIGATALSSIPAGIIERDDALQMNIANTRKYMALNREFTHTNNSDRTAYEARMYNLACDNARRGHDAFFNSVNVDSRIIEMRAWFATLKPQQRELTLPCPVNFTPFAACMAWVQETLVSPVINLSQNPVAMLINYFASMHASRWYEDPNDPHLNVIMAGDGMSGKSFILNAVAYLSTPGVCNVTDHMSTHAMHVQKNMDGFCYIIHEMQHRYLFPAVTGKDGGAAESGDALTFFKARLTKGRSSVVILKTNKETGERDVEMLESSNQGVTLAATNDSLTHADDNLLTRFLVLSVPRPRDQAEGCSAADRENTDERENVKVTEEHYKENVKRAHQLIRFRCSYAEFMIKCGVLPNGFMTGGSRILIDAVLTEMEQSHTVETRDPRRRKLTEEMARSIALFFSQWISLGTPYARTYAKRNSVDLWSWQAFMELAVPFMFTSKEATIAALTMLETIWSPSYYSRIIFSMAFGVAHLEKLESRSFLHTYRHRAAPSMSDTPEYVPQGMALQGPSNGVPDPRYAGAGNNFINGQRGGMANANDFEIDYDYVVIEADTDQAIWRTIADNCSRFGIRSADIETFVAKQCKQYISTRHLILKPRVLPKPDKPADKPSNEPAPPLPISPTNAFNRMQQPAAVSKGTERPDGMLGNSLRAAIIEAQERTDTLPAAADATTAMSVDAATEMSADSRMVADMDATLDAFGFPPKRSKPEVKRDTVDAAKRGDVHGTAGFSIVEDTSRPEIRIPVMIRGYKNTHRPNDGRQLRIATAFFMQRLGFDISKPDTMRELMLRDQTVKHEPMPDVQIFKPKPFGELSNKVREARVTPPDSYEWGQLAEHNFAARMKVARGLGVVHAATDSSPMARSISFVLENAYMNRAAMADTEAQALLDGIYAEHDAAFMSNPDPSKDPTLRYPWHVFPTCYPSGDYVLKSQDSKRYPNGRQISFYDLLKVMPLHCKPRNTRPLKRINYARLDAVGRDLLNPMPFGEAGEDYALSDRLVLSSERTRKLRAAHGIQYTADVDYYEARERLSSICHPGLPLMRDAARKLGAWSPITFQFMRNLTLSMINANQIDPRSRDTVAAHYANPKEPVLYPEDDPRIMVEYPSTLIATRIRSMENIDRSENNQVYNHLITADDVFMLDDHTGHLAFYQNDVEKAKRALEKLPNANPKDTAQFNAAGITAEMRAAARGDPHKRKLGTEPSLAGVMLGGRPKIPRRRQGDVHNQRPPAADTQVAAALRDKRTLERETPLVDMVNAWDAIVNAEFNRRDVQT